MSQIAFSAAPPPQILYNPAQQILTYAGFCPSAATISTYPSYPLPLQVQYKMVPFAPSENLELLLGTNSAAVGLGSYRVCNQVRKLDPNAQACLWDDLAWVLFLGLSLDLQFSLVVLWALSVSQKSQCGIRAVLWQSQR